MQRRLLTGGGFANDGQRFGLRGAREYGHARLDDTGLFACDRFDRLAQDVRVIQSDRRDHGQAGLHDVRGVEPSAQSHFHHGQIDLLLGKVQKAERHRGLKKAGLHLLEKRATAGHGLLQPRRGRRDAVDAHALADMPEMR